MLLWTAHHAASCWRLLRNADGDSSFYEQHCGVDLFSEHSLC